MKKLVLSLDKDALPKGIADKKAFSAHHKLCNSMCYHIAMFNGGHYGDVEKNADSFIKDMLKGTGLQLIKVNDATYRFGKRSGKKWTPYGEVIKSVFLN